MKDTRKRSIYSLPVSIRIDRFHFSRFAPLFWVTESLSDCLRLAFQQNGCVRYDQERLVTLHDVEFEIRTLSQVKEAQDLDKPIENTSRPKDPSPPRFFCYPSTCHRPNHRSQERSEGVQAHRHPSLLRVPCIRNDSARDLPFK